MKQALFILFLTVLIFPYHVFPQNHKLKQLTFSKTTHDGYPYWSPDGKYIIYSSGTRETCHTQKIPAVGGTPELITESFAQHARWSPDGNYFVYDGDFGKIMQLLPVNGGNPVRIIPPDIPIKNSGMPCWSPDSKKIAFTSLGTIYTMDLGTGTCRKIFEKEGKIAIPFQWNAASTYIISGLRDKVNRGEADIWQIPVGEGETKQITFLKGRQVKPSWSPDESMILFTSDHGGNVDLWVMAAAGGDPLQLTFYKGEGNNPGYDLEGSWSPDGKKIAFSSTRGDIWAIWVMEPDLTYIRKKLGIQ